MQLSITLYTSRKKKAFVPAIPFHPSPPLINSHTPLTLRPNLHTLILPRLDILQRPLKVLPGALQPAHVLGRIKVALDQLDQAVDVFGGDSLVLLVEVVDVAVEDFDEELDAHGGVHAGIGDA